MVDFQNTVLLCKSKIFQSSEQFPIMFINIFIEEFILMEIMKFVAVFYYWDGYFFMLKLFESCIN